MTRTTAIAARPIQSATRRTGTRTRAESARVRSTPSLPTVPARPPCELEQRGVERVGTEVGPQAVGEHELRVGRLPDEEVADPLLAAGPDDEVGVGQAARVQGLADRPLVDVLGRDAGGGDAPERVHELGAAGVVPRDVEVEARAARGPVECALDRGTG